jgi:ATP-dependent helicase IRC3
VTAAVLTPRDYQVRCQAALEEGFEAGDNFLGAVLPTGGGKTIVFAHLARQHFEQHGTRVLVLVHTDELVSQAHAKLRAVAPGLRIGIVKAWRNDVRADIIVGSVQTLRNAGRRAAIRNVGLVIVDECHHAVAKSYQTIIDHFTDTTNDNERIEARVCGFTATMARGDGKGLGDVWSQVAYRKSISWMVRHGAGPDHNSIPVAPGYGYLLDPRGKRIEVDDLDLRTVKRSGADFQNASLGTALSRAFAPEIVARAYVEHASDRSGILFAPTVDSAYEFEAALAREGIKAETVHGDKSRMTTEERRNILARLEDGRTQVVCNCMVLTEGFDSPRVSCVVIGRPTRSVVLYQQMVGRALRPYPDQTDALILDVTGASALHSLASLVDLSETVTRAPRDGQSLTELEDELEAGLDEALGGGRPDFDPRHTGPTVAVDFDPLAQASKRVWSVTTGGTWFLSAGEVYVFLTPSVEADAPVNSYDIVWTRKDRKAHKPPITYDGVTGVWGFTSHRAIPLDLAFAWGEEVAAELGGPDSNVLMMKNRQWRKQPPTDAQAYAVRSRGLEMPHDATRGSVSVLLDTWAASQLIDPATVYFEELRRENRERVAVDAE